MYVLNKLIKKYEVKKILRVQEKDNSSNKVIGVKEIESYLKKRVNIKEVEEKITIKTRQYAKRQSTWARGQMINWQKLKPKELKNFLKKI